MDRLVMPQGEHCNAASDRDSFRSLSTRWPATAALRLLTGRGRAYETPGRWKFTCTAAADWPAAANRMRHHDA
ncbi:hypothetical protein VTN96DRAFT_3921 [Rasamsonia emersonii]